VLPTKHDCCTFFLWFCYVFFFLGGCFSSNPKKIKNIKKTNIKKQNQNQSKNHQKPNHSPGEKADYAYIEFAQFYEAKEWVDGNRPTPLVCGVPVHMDYETSEWRCNHCPSVNHGRRKMCRDCNAPKEDSCVLVAAERMDPAPIKRSPVLMVSGLATQTTESTLEYIFGQYKQFKSVKFEMRDGEKSAHRGFAFVKFGSTAAATDAFNVIKEYDGQLDIDGNEVVIKYGKESEEEVAYSEAVINNSAASAAIEAALAMSRPRPAGGSAAAAAAASAESSTATDQKRSSASSGNASWRACGPDARSYVWILL